MMQCKFTCSWHKITVILSNFHAPPLSSLLQDFKSWVENSKQDSVLTNLITAGYEIVWISDRHPYEIHYVICADPESATVTVIFLGNEGIMGRLRNSDMTKQPNPIAHEEYEGSEAFINVRSAIAEEILRPRRDTGKTTIDEIRDKVKHIGREVADASISVKSGPL